jgi:hypothetical protein
MKIYLDNSIIGRLVDIAQSVKAPELRLRQDIAALPNLLALCNTRSYLLCISADAQTEIIKVGRTDRREELLGELERFMLLPPAHEQGATSSIITDLEQFLLSKTCITKAEKRESVHWDAVHLASCRLNSCHVFLTTDYGSIWAYRRALKRLYGIDVKRPSEFYQELTTALMNVVLTNRQGRASE